VSQATVGVIVPLSGLLAPWLLWQMIATTEKKSEKSNR